MHHVFLWVARTSAQRYDGCAHPSPRKRIPERYEGFTQNRGSCAHRRLSCRLHHQRRNVWGICDRFGHSPFVTLSNIISLAAQLYLCAQPLSLKMPTLSTSTLTLMAVQANTSWQDTGITVSRGETVKIAYLCGRWCPWTGFCLDGQGCVNVDPAVCSPNPDDAANLISALHASLIARIGENPAFPGMCRGEPLITLPFTDGALRWRDRSFFISGGSSAGISQ